MLFAIYGSPLRYWCLPWLAHTELYPSENWPLFLWHNNGCNQKCWSYQSDSGLVYCLPINLWKLCLSKPIFSNWTNLLEGAASYSRGAVGDLNSYLEFLPCTGTFLVCDTFFLFVWPLIELNVGFEFYLFSFRWFIQGEVRYCSPAILSQRKWNKVRYTVICGCHCLIYCKCTCPFTWKSCSC